MHTINLFITRRTEVLRWLQYLQLEKLLQI